MEFLQILFSFQFILFTRVEKLKSSERKTYICLDQWLRKGREDFFIPPILFA